MRTVVMLAAAALLVACTSEASAPDTDDEGSTPATVDETSDKTPGPATTERTPKEPAVKTDVHPLDLYMQNPRGSNPRP